jgi:hypothetical protein
MFVLRGPGKRGKARERGNAFIIDGRRIISNKIKLDLNSSTSQVMII